MAWAAIGGAAVGVVGNYLLNSDKGSGSSSSSYSPQQAVQAADPFAGQRFQYQQALARLMGMPVGPSGIYGSEPATPYSSPGGTGFGGAVLNATAQHFNLTEASPQQGAGYTGGSMGSGTGYIYRPGISTAQGGTGASGSFTPSDPSYNFRLQSGAEAVQRAMGAKGMNGSGNQMAALMQYGQNLASTEYQNEFQRLAVLSGAESGSPAAAGQLGLQGQQMQANTDAATLAQWNQWLSPAYKAAGNSLGNWLGGNSSSGGGDGGGAAAGGGVSGDGGYTDPFAAEPLTS